MPVYPAGSGTPTMELWVPCTANSINMIGDFAAQRATLTGNSLSVAFMIPWDFTALVSAVFILIPGVTNATYDYDIYTDYAAVGEAYNTHSEASGFLNVATTQNQILSMNIAPYLTNIALGDYVGVTFTIRENLTMYGIGVRFRYS